MKVFYDCDMKPRKRKEKKRMRISYAAELEHAQELTNNLWESVKTHVDKWLFIYFWSGYLILCMIALAVFIWIFA